MLNTHMQTPLRVYLTMIFKNNAKNISAESFQCFNIGNFLQKAIQQDYSCMLQGQQ